MNYISFLSGVYIIAFSASGLIFLRFFKATGDRFFKYFCFACWMLAIERIVLFFIATGHVSQTTITPESETWVYFFRLFAFLMIVYAIVDKNRNP